MNLEIISYNDLLKHNNSGIENRIKNALYGIGIIGVSDIPDFQQKVYQYIQFARQFSNLDETIKKQYAPDRDAGDTEGYELGAEWFKDKNDNWKIDDKKASFYAFIPDHIKNKWPREVDLKTSYLALGELISLAGKKVLHYIGINEKIGIPHDKLVFYGRMLHYHSSGLNDNTDENWCGAHFDHGIFTGLIPAHYFCNDVEMDEPEEAGLFVLPTNGTEFEKVEIPDKNILLFQTGEFAQLASHDKIRATKHTVRKVKKNIERYTFALFYNALDSVVIQSKSVLAEDARYTENCLADGSITYGKWSEASYARYRAIQIN